jgi:hypothetical protein
MIMIKVVSTLPGIGLIVASGMQTGAMQAVEIDEIASANPQFVLERGRVEC